MRLSDWLDADEKFLSQEGRTGTELDQRGLTASTRVIEILELPYDES